MKVTLKHLQQLKNRRDEWQKTYSLAWENKKKVDDQATATNHEYKESLREFEKSESDFKALSEYYLKNINLIDSNIEYFGLE